MTKKKIFDHSKFLFYIIGNYVEKTGVRNSQVFIAPGFNPGVR